MKAPPPPVPPAKILPPSPGFETPPPESRYELRSRTPKSGSSAPSTPNWMAPLSRELEAVIAEKNLLTGRTRKKVLADLDSAAAAGEDATVERLRYKV